MDASELQDCLAHDLLSEAVLEEHGLSKTLLSMLNVSIASKKHNVRFAQAKTPADSGLTIEIGQSVIDSAEDIAELTHKIAHQVLDDIKDGALWKYAIDRQLVDQMDTEVLEKSRSVLAQRLYREYENQYTKAFIEPRVGMMHLTRLLRIAKRIQLQRLTFSEEERDIMNKIRQTAVRRKESAYLVGGSIRDKLMGEESNDLDFMIVTDDLDGFMKDLTTANDLRTPVKLERSGAYTLRIGNIDVDIIDAKRIYTPMGSHEEETLEEDDDWTIALDDIYRRDLTINTIAYDLVHNEVKDPTGRGLQDLASGTLNTVIDPYAKYRLNAFDMLRALRFAAVHDFKLGPEMLEAMKTNSKRIVPREKGGDISARRIARELRKAADNADSWYRMKKLLAETGLIDNLLEEIEHVERERMSPDYSEDSR